MKKGDGLGEPRTKDEKGSEKIPLLEGVAFHSMTHTSSRGSHGKEAGRKGATQNADGACWVNECQ